MSRLSRQVRDIVFFPVRCLLPNNEYIGFLGVTPISDERFQAVRPHLKGRVLDLGCGDNRLVREYRQSGGEGIGADLAGNQMADVHIVPGEPLPFPDGSFETITLIAALNHIPDRERVLRECHRCLTPGGRIALTMLGRVVGSAGHFIWRILGSDADHGHRHEAEGELMGLSDAEVRDLLARTGFADIRRTMFTMWLNNLYVAEKSRG